MVREVYIPFSHVDELKEQYDNKYLIITDCEIVNYPWKFSGILRAVCDTYIEGLDTEIKYYKDRKYNDIKRYAFPHKLERITNDFTT